MSCTFSRSCTVKAVVVLMLVAPLGSCHGKAVPKTTNSRIAYGRIIENGHYVSVPIFDTLAQTQHAHLKRGQAFIVRHPPPRGLKLASDADLIGKRTEVAPGVFSFSGTISYFDPHSVSRGTAKWCRLTNDRLLCLVGRGQRLNVWMQGPGGHERSIVTLDPSVPDR